MANDNMYVRILLRNAISDSRIFAKTSKPAQFPSLSPVCNRFSCSLCVYCPCTHDSVSRSLVSSRLSIVPTSSPVFVVITKQFLREVHTYTLTYLSRPRDKDNNMSIMDSKERREYLRKGPKPYPGPTFAQIREWENTLIEAHR